MIMTNDLINKIRFPLFTCRLSIFLVYLAWTWDKLFNAAHGASIMNRHYSLDFVTAPMVFGLGFLELVFILVFLLGFYKRIVRGLIIIFCVISTFGPKVVDAYIRFFDPAQTELDSISQLFHPQFLLPAFCMLICSIVIYVMRDYDTLYSFSKADRGNY
jgi:hypothetical protein